MNVGEREGGYITISNSILANKDLSLTEKVVLGRIAGFDEYFESKEVCAEMLGIPESSVRKAKTRLEKDGYIKALVNTGHGKRYVVDNKWKSTPAKTAETNIGAIKTPQTQNLSHPQFSSSTSEKSMVSKPKNNWDRQHPDLIDVRDRAIIHLRHNSIPVNIPVLNGGISTIADTFPDNDVAFMINSYIDYLESPAYLYQKEHNQYCPRLKSTNDFCEKFASIRDFKANKKRHYDPNKVLTKD